MFHYTMIQWIFFFYLYCFIGWCFESSYVSIRKKHWVNRGFMRGPFLPLYGSGAIMMLLVSMPFHDNLILVYLAGCVGATALELVTGEAMEALFKVRYWDYSKLKFNYKGHICLSSTLAWGFLTVLMTQFIQKGVEKIAFAVPTPFLEILVGVLTIGIVADFALSFKTALDLRDVLVGLEKAKTEMEHIQKRLDVMIALAADEREAKKEARRGANSLRMEELVEQIEECFAKIKARIKLDPSAFVEDAREELMELRSKFTIEKEHGIQFKGLRSYFEREMIKGNPDMQSKRFAEALEELKKSVMERMKK